MAAETFGHAQRLGCAIIIISTVGLPRCKCYVGLGHGFSV